ncbi:hypothetical protein [Stackebrandtia nassauensis]|uniref:Uncharacterized protein n=1 Tax=Stackebrandtia nassauensis (strain DSM 44728 / CIP 108903 / NRRL B-16338 / NBRC 102104 / LLR-40K-21) TaxID=446470 RepID=D3PZC2_STANL|nr:hypothetical protein [Stackebrandtia nassauensis]ADD41596.1 hypothetical protein Snas_1900 [Stackebrandtia nassauensis DSM 44728]
MTGYRSPLPKGRDGFGQLVRAEWTKLRSVYGWIAGLAMMAVTIVGLGTFIAWGSTSSCMEGNKEVTCPKPPLGPEGDAVTDKFYFVNQPLTGDGDITVRVTEMSDNIDSGTAPWAKAGIMIKENLKQGSSYAAVMATADHGVRMQHDYKYDTAGKPGRPSPDEPRWLRLDRDGDTITGSESRDGKTWTTVDKVRLAGLPETVHIGMFAASPGSLNIGPAQFGGSVQSGQMAPATGVFDEVTAPGDDWDAADIGATEAAEGPPHLTSGHTVDDGVFTVSGSGDIAPYTEGHHPEATLPGVWIGLIALVVVAVGFVTVEYRRGMIRTSLLASPRRGRVLLAKATVLGSVTFVLALVAIAFTVTVGKPLLRGGGNFILPVPVSTEIRVIVGTAAVLALTAVLSLAIGALFRRGLTGTVTAITVMILPFLVTFTAVLPHSVPQWLLRVTPAAGFAITQGIPEYPHVYADYSPANGYYPLPPWAGLLVLTAFAAATLWLAVRRLSRRDT